MKKSIFLLVILCCCLLFMVACNNDTTDPGTDDPGTTDPGTDDPGTADDGDVFTVKMNLQDPEEHDVMVPWVQAAEAAVEASDGRLEITRYASGVLGDYLTIYEDLQRGAVDLSVMSLSETFNDLFNVMIMPYTVSSYDQAKVLYNPDGTGEFFNLFKQGCEESGTYLLSVGLAGFLGVSCTGFSDEEIADLLTPGVKHGNKIIRVPMMESYVKIGEALGFSVTTIAYGDVYTSLQTGVCDGVIGTPCVTAWQNFRDVVNYWVDYRYTLETVWIVTSLDLKERMPEDLWTILEDTFLEYFKVGAENNETINNECIQNFIDEKDGALVPTDEELAPMKQHVQDTVYPYFAEYYKDRGGQEFVDQLVAMGTGE